MSDEITEKMAVEPVNQWPETVEPYIIEQYKESQRWQSILKAAVDLLQDADNALVDFSNILDIGNIRDPGHLEFLASLVNVIRMDGESDAKLAERFFHRLGSNRAGTPDFAIESSALVSSCEKEAVLFLEEFPASFLIFTPKGKQMDYSSTRKMAPAGVLGVSGAVIQFCDGDVMCDCENGDVILAVADSEKSGSYSPDFIKEIF